MITTWKHETRHIVAVLDLIGATKLIEGSHSEAVLNKIAYLFKEVENNWPYLEKAPTELHNIQCVTFSDNIAVAVELPEELTTSEIGKHISSFITYIGIFQAASLRNNLLFRGGISVGLLYIDSAVNLIWGKALVDAHVLEDKYAIYPRVILDNNIMMQELPSDVRVMKDKDGKYVVDYLMKVKEKLPEWIKGAKTLVQDSLEEFSDNEHIKKKYMWLDEYIHK